MSFVQEKKPSYVRSMHGKEIMITYSVTIAVEATIEAEWVEWMKKIHIPDVLRTGCFAECRIYKVFGSEGDEVSYVMQYQCRSLEEYHRYRDNFAPALQKEHTDRFAGKFRGSRQLLDEVAIMSSRADASTYRCGYSAYPYKARMNMASAVDAALRRRVRWSDSLSSNAEWQSPALRSGRRGAAGRNR